MINYKKTNEDLRFFIDSAENENYILKFEPELVLEVKKNNNYFLIQDYNIGLDLYADSMENFEKEIEHEIYFLWNEYANEYENKLSRIGKQIRKNLLNRISKINK